MNEEILRDYFRGEVEPEMLNDNLIGTNVKTGSHSSGYEITDMSMEFDILPKHIIQLCKDVLLDKIQPEHLQIIAFALISSENFNWDCEDQKCDQMDAVLHEWCSPEINYALDKNNVQKCLKRLE